MQLRTLHINLCLTLVISIGIVLASENADADIIFHVIESGDNVQSTLSGSLDLNATLGFRTDNTNTIPFIGPDTGLITNGEARSDAYAVSAGAWTPFGAGGYARWDDTTGDRVALFSSDAIGVPLGYVSGDPLSGTATEFDASFATLGMTPGVYVTNISNGTAVDAITVIVGVPEPGSGLLIAFIGGWFAVIPRRRRREC